MQPLIGFGAFSTLENLAFAGMTTADVLIVGHMLGAADLGVYAVTLNFAAMPLNKIAPIINSVAFPAFALVQSDPVGARFYAMKALRLMALMVVPVFAGIALTAPEIVDVVFGPQWAAARVLLPFLAVALVFRAMLIVPMNFLQGIGDAKGAFLSAVLGAGLLPLAILIGCLWGLAGVGWAWLLCYPVIFAITAALVGARGSLDVRSILAAPLRPILACLPMAGVVLGLRAWLPLAMNHLLGLAVLAMLGAAAYATTIWTMFPALRRELLGLADRGSGDPV